MCYPLFDELSILVAERLRHSQIGGRVKKQWPPVRRCAPWVAFTLLLLLLCLRWFLLPLRQ